MQSLAKAKLERLSDKVSGRSFLCYQLNLPAFDLFWHYHPEYELTYIVSGKGKRLVGSSCESYLLGDFVLLGPNLPHAWVSEKNKKQKCSAVVIQFSSEFIEPFLQFKELFEVKKLLSKSDRGIKFITERHKDVESMMQQMVKIPPSHQLIRLIEILLMLAGVKAILLTPVAFIPLRKSRDQKRINIIFQYVQNEFKQTISVSKAASLIHLSESAFCKYFKRISGKTFSGYVNEIRIAHACQLLIETDRLISQIAIDSGFVSLTYFNRVFLKRKKLSPKEYRKLE